MIVKFEVLYNIGQIVYLITDHEENKYMVTSFLYGPNGSVMYVLKSSVGVSDHYDFEITELSPNLLGSN